MMPWQISKCGGEADGFNRDVDTLTFSQFHDALDGVSIGSIDRRGCSEGLRDFQAVIVQIDAEDRSRGVEPGSHPRGQADRAGAGNGDQACRTRRAIGRRRRHASPVSRTGILNGDFDNVAFGLLSIS